MAGYLHAERIEWLEPSEICVSGQAGRKGFPEVVRTEKGEEGQPRR